MICYRNCDRRWPFLWETSDQPSARWNAAGDGPAQYLADTPYGAWAEFLRHEEIHDEVDLMGVSRALWAVDVDVANAVPPGLPTAVMTGDIGTYAACQAEARNLRDDGVSELRAPSAALKEGGASGYRVELGFKNGPPTDGVVYVLFGARPEVVGWLLVDEGRPPVEVLARTQYL
jgi:hypothetical protein